MTRRKRRTLLTLPGLAVGLGALVAGTHQGRALIRPTWGFEGLDANPRVHFEPEADAARVAEVLARTVERVESAQGSRFPEPPNLFVCGTQESFNAFLARPGGRRRDRGARAAAVVAPVLARRHVRGGPRPRALAPAPASAAVEMTSPACPTTAYTLRGGVEGLELVVSCRICRPPARPARLLRGTIGAVPGHLHRTLVRSVRRAVFRLRGRRLPIVYDSRYERGVFGVPLDPLRGQKVLLSLHEAGLLGAAGASAPRPASLHNILRVHSESYLHSLQEPETLTRILGVTVSAEEAEATVDHQRLMVGGTIQATRLALRTGGIAVHLGGGLHHASAEAGQGFCVFNDVAVAIRRLRARGYEERVLVVDLDLHDGNGTRAIFADDPTVHTYSVHNDDWGNVEAVASTAIALGAEVGDERFLDALRETLPRLFETFRPKLVVYLAGTDGAAEDPVGNWRLSAEGLVARDRLVTALAGGDGEPLPMVVVLAGGYGPRAWRHSSRYLLWLISGRAIEPLPDEELSLQRFRRLGRDLRDSEASDDGLPFTLTDEDLGALAPGAGTTSGRFLDVFSRHGVELLLERSGILAQLRSRGFRALRVDLDTSDGVHTLRVLTDDPPDTVLVELRAQRSRRAVPGLEVIALEWLLLQNPRGEFSPARPRLPGQHHPGLGLLKDIMGWLVVVCETHGLDGIFFTVSHYHIAVQSRRLVRPLDPGDDARLEALTAALRDLSLAEAAAAVAAGRVVDAKSGEAIAWTPIPTILPVSERLRARVSGPEYAAAAARERSRFAFRLRDGDLTATAR